MNKKIASTLSSLVVHFFKAYCVFWLIWHFALTFFYSMPINPVKVGLNPLLQMTIGTFYQQNWSLFAPNPVSSNQTLSLYPIKDSSEAIKKNEGWYQITSSLVAAYHCNRVSSYERIGRIQNNAMRLFFGNSPELYPWRRACENGDDTACLVQKELTEMNRKIGLRYLGKIGSSFCNSLNEEYGFFALKITTSHSLPWSERYQGSKPEESETLVGIFKVDKNITPSTFFRIP